MTDTSESALHDKDQWELKLSTIVEDNTCENLCCGYHEVMGIQLLKNV